jgi:hypothetical protein
MSRKRQGTLFFEKCFYIISLLPDSKNRDYPYTNIARTPATQRSTSSRVL